MSEQRVRTMNHVFEGSHASHCSRCGRHWNSTIHVTETATDAALPPMDDSEPTLAALQSLANDGYATDRQRQTARMAINEILLIRGGRWQAIETAPKDGTPLRLFDEALIDPDFNPSGSVEGYWQDDDGWVGAVWNSRHDLWDREQVRPSLWQPLPEPPTIRRDPAAEGGGR